MTTAQHTPGPWEIKDCQSDPTVYQLLSAAGGVIAFPRRGTGGQEEKNIRLATARLIAAAPELLDALQALLDADMTTQSGIDATNQARAAIVKARGQA